MPTSRTVFLADETATTRLGAAFAAALRQRHAAVAAHGLAIGLSGELGAGKTALVRALLRALGVTGPVKSPSYALLEPYVVSSLNFYHFDFYRFSDPEEFAAAGFRELFGPGSVCAIEWPERARGKLPTLDLLLTLSVQGDGRAIEIAALTEMGEQCQRSVIEHWAKDDGG